MTSQMQTFLQKIDAGWQPPAIPPAEYLARVRLQLQALASKITSVAPELAAELARYLAQGEALTAIAETEAELEARVEQRYPGLWETYQALDRKELALSKEIA